MRALNLVWISLFFLHGTSFKICKVKGIFLSPSFFPASISSFSHCDKKKVHVSFPWDNIKAPMSAFSISALLVLFLLCLTKIECLTAQFYRSLPRSPMDFNGNSMYRMAAEKKLKKDVNFVFSLRLRVT